MRTSLGMFGVLAAGLSACTRGAAPSALQATAPVCQDMVREDLRAWKIDDDIYVVQAGPRNGVPNKTISFVVTNEGAVAIDTGREATAEIAKSFLREITSAPLSYIIYTHHHGTQVHGARVLADPGTKFIAHESFPLEIQWTHDLQEFNRRLNNIQFDLELPEDGDWEDPPLPDITYKQDYAFELGGTRFELHHVEGEARDYTVIWLPDRHYAWVGDLVSDGFPMVASPMKPVRDPLMWKSAVDWIAKQEPRVLVNALEPPDCDRQHIVDALKVQSELLGFVHESVVAELNAGRSADQAVREIALPPDLATVPQRYGTLEFAIRGVYQEYSGWFDQDGTDLRPAPADEVSKRFVASMGGRDAVLAQADELAAGGRQDLALQYLDLLIGSAPDPEALRRKAALLQAYGATPATGNRIVRNMYDALATDALTDADTLEGHGPSPPGRGKAGKAGKAKGGKAPHGKAPLRPR